MNISKPIEPSIAVRLEDVTKRFFSGTANEVVALDRISFDILAGEWLYVLGGNGSGKSTLLRAISGQCHPEEGRVVHRDNGCFAIHFVEFGSHHDLIPSMTIYENLMLVNTDRSRIPRLRNYHKKIHEMRFVEVLGKFGLGLEKRLGDQVVGLSGGQQQAVVAAKVLLSSATILLLDEFTSALDKKTAPIILRILRDHCRTTGITVIAVTHDYHWIDDTADRVVLMEGGKIVEIMHRSGYADVTDQISDDLQQIKHTKVHKFTTEIVMERLYGST